MRIILIRHGQTDANKKEIIQGWLDLKLNETGIKQAKLLAKRLKSEDIDVFYSSDLKRAVMTTEELKKFHPSAPWVKSSIIRERNFGRLEGVYVKYYHELLKCYGLKNYEFRPPFGESYQDVRRRAEIFFREIKRKHKNQNVVVVAHGAFNRAFISYLANMSLKDAMEIQQENTCMNIIEVKSKPKVIALNDFSHLNGNVF
jgi:broad specificity phosphatase PhoE